MPAIYTHLRFGEEVAKTLSPQFQALLEKYTGAFRLGTQGPDILFYHHPMKKNEIRKFGTQLHARSGERVFLEQGKKLLEDEHDEAFKAYVCGFLCHFTLDVICHPYIDGHSTEKVSHGKIESELDKFVLRKDGKKIRGYNTAKVISRDEETANACAKSLGVPKENIAVAIKTIRKINKMFSFPFEPFHWIAHAFLKLVKMERKFGDMFLHRKNDPLCKEPNEALFEKFQTAIPTAAALIEEYFANLKASVENGKFENELFRYNFSGIKDTED